MQLDSLRKDAQSNVRQMRATRAVGLGCLAALALLLAQRTAPLALSAGVEAYKPFLAAILSGFVAMGVLGCLACHAQTYGQGGPSASGMAADGNAGFGGVRPCRGRGRMPALSA